MPSCESACCSSPASMPPLRSTSNIWKARAIESSFISSVTASDAGGVCREEAGCARALAATAVATATGFAVAVAAGLAVAVGLAVGLAVAVAVALAVGIIATLACWLRAALVKPSSQEPSAVLAKGGQAADGKDTQDRREMLVIPS